MDEFDVDWLVEKVVEWIRSSGEWYAPYMLISEIERVMCFPEEDLVLFSNKLSTDLFLVKKVGDMWEIILVKPKTTGVLSRNVD